MPPIAFSRALKNGRRHFATCRASAPARKDIRRGLRMLVASNYLILYGFDARRDELEIVAVVMAIAS
jgi:hypothetical protein